MTYGYRVLQVQIFPIMPWSSCLEQYHHCWTTEANWSANYILLDLSMNVAFLLGSIVCFWDNKWGMPQYQTHQSHVLKSSTFKSTDIYIYLISMLITSEVIVWNQVALYVVLSGHDLTDKRNGLVGLYNSFWKNVPSTVQYFNICIGAKYNFPE